VDPPIESLHMFLLIAQEMSSACNIQSLLIAVLDLIRKKISIIMAIYSTACSVSTMKLRLASYTRQYLFVF